MTQTMTERGWRSAWAAIGLAYAVCGIAALAFAGARLHAPDEFEYLAIGQNLAKTGLFSLDGTTPTAWRAPGLPVLISVIWMIWPSVIVLKCGMVACWAGTGVLVGRIAAQLYGERTGQIAACLYLGYLYELYAATTLYPQIAAGLLITASVWLALRKPALGATCQGLLLGATILEVCLVPNCVLVPVVVYSYALLKRRMRLWQAAAAAVLTIAIVLGWCMRNERALGVFGFTTSMGVTLYDGNRDHITAASAGSPDGLDLPDHGRGLSEVTMDALYRARAVAWLSAHPWPALKLFAGKFFYFFAYSNTLETKHHVPFMNALTAMMAVLYYSAVAGAVAAGVSRERNVRDAAWITWALYIGTAVSYAVFLTRIRYRLPYDPLLFAVAPGALLALADRRLRAYRLVGGPATPEFSQPSWPLDEAST